MSFMLGFVNKPSMLNVIMLNVVMLNAIMLNVVMLNAIMLNVVMLNVAVLKTLENFVGKIIYLLTKPLIRSVFCRL